MDGCSAGTYYLDSALSGGEIKGACDIADKIKLTVECNSDKSATISWFGQGDSIMAIKVKGGNGGTLYDAGGNNGGRFIAGYNNGGNVAGISHIEICLNCQGSSCYEDVTEAPTEGPTSFPTNTPSSAPTEYPTNMPSSEPTAYEVSRKRVLEDEHALEDKYGEVCGKQMFFEDFDDEWGGAWGDIPSDASKSKFLHLVNDGENHKVEKTFSVPRDALLVTLEFMFYEIGRNEKSEGACINVTIGNTAVNLDTFGADDELEIVSSDLVDGISWSLTSISDNGDLGLAASKGADQMHKVKLAIPSKHFQEGIVDFGLEVQMNADDSDESIGLDDFRVVAFAQSCDTLQTQATLPMEQDALPGICSGRVATAWGDPHMTTFDGVRYNCQGEGEFTIMKTLGTNANAQPKFEVQGRFMSFDKRRITVTRGLAIRDEGTPTIQLNVPSRYDRQCPIEMFVGKHKRNLLEGTGTEDVVVKNIGKKVVVYYPKTGLQFVVKLTTSTKYGCYFSVKACLPDEFYREETIVGLLGSPDEDPTNEFMKSDGTAYEVANPNKNEGNYEYCTKEWCVRDERKSLFVYGAGESFSKFNRCDLPYEGSVERCVANPPTWLLDICSECDKRCFYEGCAGGAEEAKIALDVEFDLNNEKGCGQVVIDEDFEENDVSEWGMIDTAPRSGSLFLGRFRKDSPSVSKEFDIPGWANYATVEFLLYEIDDWAAHNRRNNRFYVKIGDSKFHLDTFEDVESQFQPGSIKSGFKSGIHWQRHVISVDTSIGYSIQNKDQIHKVVIKVPNCYFQQGKLPIEFSVTMSAGESRISAGVDDLRITANPRKCSDMDGLDKLKQKLQLEAFMKRAEAEEKRAEAEKKRAEAEQRKILDQQRTVRGKASVEEEREEDVIASSDGSSPVECRVAFGYYSPKLSRSFKELGFTDGPATWGWSNGPFASSNYAYSFDLYPEGSDVSIGTMTVGYDGSEAVVTVDARERLWLKEVQAHIGGARLPLKEDGAETIDPEDYPVSNRRMALSRSFVVTDFEDGPIYVVAEATVCGVFSNGAAAESNDAGLGGLVSSVRNFFGNLM
ncbi:Sushi domain-containing protein 2 [Seminavis robusta]|uniref:Sushi domain-containing protein 2 n=1 Tax=Seminavis robusta TaxID=568900 RepID=A0A9N8DWK3_9STRA|nr:Sushi domain-containing protein 2 [Seminavis robusta]|eukprot:Sro327_g118290.1 Sushi domain-containing protein 2 (1071) ;mRNA; f:10976-14188